MKLINKLYIFFLGIILPITIGFGIAAFYPQPARPQYPDRNLLTVVPQSCYETPEQKATPECQTAFSQRNQEDAQFQIVQKQYDADLKAYQNKDAGYNRTAIFLGIVTGATFAILGIALIKISGIVASGLLLGGILTAILTRLMIILASLGGATAGTSGIDAVSMMEFGVLLILSIVIIFVGLFSLKEHAPSTQPPINTSQ